MAFKLVGPIIRICCSFGVLMVLSLLFSDMGRVSLYYFGRLNTWLHHSKSTDDTTDEEQRALD